MAEGLAAFGGVDAVDTDAHAFARGRDADIDRIAVGDVDDGGGEGGADGGRRLRAGEGGQKQGGEHHCGAVIAQSQPRLARQRTGSPEPADVSSPAATSRSRSVMACNAHSHRPSAHRPRRPASS